MKRLAYILPLLCLLFLGCKEDEWLDWKAQNELWLQQNIIAHEGDSLFHVTESGLQYRILNYGNKHDSKPDPESSVTCSYEGQLINGHVFDRSASASLAVSQVVDGFAEGLRKIHTGGDIILYIPQELAYGDKKDDKYKSMAAEGNYSSSFIPPYSALIFRIHIYSVYK